MLYYGVTLLPAYNEKQLVTNVLEAVVAPILRVLLIVLT